MWLLFGGWLWGGMGGGVGGVCAACCCVALVFAVMQLYTFLLLLFLPILFFKYFLKKSRVAKLMEWSMVSACHGLVCFF